MRQANKSYARGTGSRQCLHHLERTAFFRQRLEREFRGLGFSAIDPAPFMEPPAINARHNTAFQGVCLLMTRPETPETAFKQSRYFVMSRTVRIAGPITIMISAGTKNKIIGTVSLGGSAAAFFSAALIRKSLFSLAITRSASAIAVP